MENKPTSLVPRTQRWISQQSINKEFLRSFTGALKVSEMVSWDRPDQSLDPLIYQLCSGLILRMEFLTLSEISRLRKIVDAALLNTLFHWTPTCRSSFVQRRWSWEGWEGPIHPQYLSEKKLKLTTSSPAQPQVISRCPCYLCSPFVTGGLVYLL